MASSSVGVSSEGSPEPGGSGWPRREPEGEQERLLRRGELLALGNHLKEALETYSAALRLGPPAGPRRLETLVDCLVLNYRLRQGLDWSRDQGAREEGGGAVAGPLTCCGCRGFLGEPVTARCGHSYCRRCLRGELRSRCRLCRDLLLPLAGGGPAAQLRTSVILSQLAEKWFPAECERARTGNRLRELLSQGRFRESLSAASQALRAGNGQRGRPSSACALGPGTGPQSAPDGEGTCFGLVTVGARGRDLAPRVCRRERSVLVNLRSLHLHCAPLLPSALSRCESKPGMK